MPEFCPKCQTGNFTPGWLKTHVCKGALKTMKNVTPGKPPESTALATAPADLFATARRLHEQAKYFGTASVASMVMCGAEVLRLRQMLGVQQGKTIDSSQLGKSCEGMTWEQILERETGISKSTSYRYGLLAGAAAKKVKGLEAIITAAPGQVSDADRERVFKAVAKATDGYSAADVFDDWGLIPKPKPKLSASQEKFVEEVAKAGVEGQTDRVIELTRQEKAVNDWRELIQNLESYGLKAKSWKYLSDADLARLTKDLRDLLKQLEG